MYENYSTNNSVNFGNSKISLIENIECMEINSPTNFSMLALEKSFGNSDFWRSLNINE